MTSFAIGSRMVGSDQPTYFIADIAANHDGDVTRAKDLMSLAKDAGADCAKFQHFRAPFIVSDRGFKDLGSQQSHQAHWQKSVFEVYQDASLPWEWTAELADHAKDIGIEFMSAPYDLEAVDHLDPFVNAFKIGSGDVNWIEELAYVASKGKPVILATGAAEKADVDRAMKLLSGMHIGLVLMQCNTNYEGTLSNIHHINLNVLSDYARTYPDVVLGLSDHTPGHVTVLGAVALGARVIEKHFTDDVTRIGPDHAFSMDATTWAEMVEATRMLEAAMGDGVKKIEDNERETVVIQRRCVRAARDLSEGHILDRADVEVLRPAPTQAIPAHEVASTVGMKLTRPLHRGQDLTWADLINP